MTRLHHPHAFTLVELLVVVAIITVLIALLLPALGRAKELAITVKCLSNQRQIANGLAAYASDYGQLITVERDLDINAVNGSSYGAGYEIIPWAAFLCPPNRAGFQDVQPWFPNTNGAYYLNNAAVVRCPAQITSPKADLGTSYAMQHSPSFNFPTAYQSIIRYENVYVGGGSGGTKVVATSGTASGSVHVQGTVGGNTIGCYYLFTPTILRPANFILVTDAQKQASSTANGNQGTFACEGGSGNTPWFLHQNKLNCLYADGHAESITPTQAYRSECPIYNYYDEDLNNKNLP